MIRQRCIPAHHREYGISICGNVAKLLCSVLTHESICAFFNYLREDLKILALQ